MPRPMRILHCFRAPVGGLLRHARFLDIDILRGHGANAGSADENRSQ